MKKVFSFVATSLALILSASLISCKAPSGGGGAVTYIGTKTPSEAKAIGDIIFNDGSAIPYTAELTLTDEQKSKAIAVIFKVDGSKAYGVGLVHSENKLAWCLYTSKGYNTNFTDLQCTASGSGDDYSFTGDTDGSDNFEKIGKALGADDDTGTPGNYPAFEFAINYKDQVNSHVKGTSYENGWYLPAVAELFDIWKVKSTVNAASCLCGGFQFNDTVNYRGAYWSSSRSDTFYTGGPNSYMFYFDDSGGLDIGLEEEALSTMTGQSIYVCCIRKF